MSALPPVRDYRDADPALLLTVLVEPTSQRHLAYPRGCQRSRLVTHSTELPRTSSQAQRPLSVPTQDSPPKFASSEKCDVPSGLSCQFADLDIATRQSSRGTRSAFIVHRSTVSQFAVLHETAQDEGRAAPVSAHVDGAESTQPAGESRLILCI